MSEAILLPLVLLLHGQHGKGDRMLGKLKHAPSKPFLHHNIIFNITTTIDANMTINKQDNHLKLRNKLLLLGLQLMQLPAGLGRLPGLQQLGLLKDVQLQLLMSHILPFYTFRNDREIRSSV